jgi:heme oxygenase
MRAFRKTPGTPQDGRNWQNLCTALETQDDIAALEAGARHAFQRFADLLEA